jgi:hypothetical protein
MQMYDVMRLDINIFPLIRQTPSPPPRARTQFLNGKTITLDSRARARVLARTRDIIMEIF